MVEDGEGNSARSGGFTAALKTIYGHPSRKLKVLDIAAGLGVWRWPATTLKPA